MSNEEKSFLGTVERIIFRKEENGFTILSLELDKPEDGKSSIVATGCFPDVEENEYLFVSGEIVRHATYGEQLKASRYERRVPQSQVALCRYLGGGAIKGIGKAMAERIVKKFKDDTLRILEEEPERLSEVRGISEQKARDIAAQFAQKTQLRQAMIYLQGLGLSLNLATKIYNQYGEKVFIVTKENPYRIAEEVAGVGFKTADMLAQGIGIAKNANYRIEAGIQYVLSQAGGNGHTYLPKNEVLSQTAELLEMEDEKEGTEEIQRAMDELSLLRKIKIDEDAVYLRNVYMTEAAIARRLSALDVSEGYTEDELKRKLSILRSATGLADRQKEAVMTVMENGVTIITGGPGTGKTTTINVILEYFFSQNIKVKLAAPTGRAAKRMQEQTGKIASTIHRLLEFSGDPDGGMNFTRDDTNPLEADAIVIDEMSMVDIYLMNALLKAVEPGTKLVLVGDVDQLPSVGPGNVLYDLIESGYFSVVRLDQIFRQSADSDIVVNAHKINRGEIVSPRQGSKDFLFIKREDVGHVTGVVSTLVREKLPKYVEADWREIQVLTPMRKGPLGVESLNHVLQEALNPAEPQKAEKEIGQTTFREGDKVMQIKNNYQMSWKVINSFNQVIDEGIGVFNGDIGRIESINLYAEEVKVVFDEVKTAVYTFKQLEELELAYAVTIHKSQGSEYPAVVLPLLSGPPLLMNRRLLYTAVTRAKKCVTIVGSLETFQHMIENATRIRRYSGLQKRLKEEHAADH